MITDRLADRGGAKRSLVSFCANGVKRKVAKDAERVAGYTPKLVIPLFLLPARGTKEKAWQKENAD
ncbi:MAG: hypothetical protein IJX62_06185 [Clostridia bacterium]|nr:hypothetical protein [Clostridia bacterium]